MEVIPTDTINKRIKELRTESDLTQKEFADILGVTQAGVSAMEQSGRKVSDLTIKSICNQFNINEAWLRTGVLPKYSGNRNDFTAQIDQILSGENDFAKTIFKMFANYSDEDWKALNHLVSKFREAQSISDMPQTEEELLAESALEKDFSKKVI